MPKSLDLDNHRVVDWITWWGKLDASYSTYAHLCVLSLRVLHQHAPALPWGVMGAQGTVLWQLHVQYSYIIIYSYWVILLENQGMTLNQGPAFAPRLGCGIAEFESAGKFIESRSSRATTKKWDTSKQDIPWYTYKTGNSSRILQTSNTNIHPTTHEQSKGFIFTLGYFHISMDWFKGKFTGKPLIFNGKIYGFL